MIKKTILVLIITLFCSTFISAQAVVKIVPRKTSEDMNKTFTVDVTVTNISHLWGASIAIAFDAEKVQYTAHSGFSNGDMVTDISFDKLEGNVITVDMTNLDSPEFNGSGTLFSLDFLALKEGTANFSFSKSILRNPGNNDITSSTVPGSIVITNPVPVELTEFTGSEKNGEVVLQWKTATEINCYGFEVERNTPPAPSQEGITPPAGIKKGWETIGFVKGAGTSFISHTYTFTDHTPSSGQAEYRLKQIDIDGQFKYYDAISITVNAPKQYRLLQNSPNPFNPSTAIKFQMPVDGLVTIKIYDQIGREVTTLVNEVRSAGSHIVYWNGRDMNGQTVSSGIYLYRLSSNGFAETRKMNYLK